MLWLNMFYVSETSTWEWGRKFRVAKALFVASTEILFPDSLKKKKIKYFLKQKLLKFIKSQTLSLFYITD